MEAWEVAAREGTRQTLSSYNYAGDRGDLAGLAATFADDGELVLEGATPVRGPAAIEAHLASVLSAEPRPSHVHHHVAAVHFLAVEREAVDCSAYFTVLTDIGTDHWGRYRDRLVRVDGTWRFAQRRVMVAGFAAGSFFTC
jgi:uncharacterized protein (TIGR02246 family)